MRKVPIAKTKCLVKASVAGSQYEEEVPVGQVGSTATSWLKEAAHRIVASVEKQLEGAEVTVHINGKSYQVPLTKTVTIKVTPLVSVDNLRCAVLGKELEIPFGSARHRLLLEINSGKMFQIGRGGNRTLLSAGYIDIDGNLTEKGTACLEELNRCKLPDQEVNTAWILTYTLLCPWSHIVYRYWLRYNGYLTQDENETLTVKGERWLRSHVKLAIQSRSMFGRGGVGRGGLSLYDTLLDYVAYEDLPELLASEDERVRAAAKKRCEKEQEVVRK